MRLMSTNIKHKVGEKYQHRSLLVPNPPLSHCLLLVVRVSPVRLLVLSTLSTSGVTTITGTWSVTLPE